MLLACPARGQGAQGRTRHVRALRGTCREVISESRPNSAWKRPGSPGSTGRGRARTASPRRTADRRGPGWSRRPGYVPLRRLRALTMTPRHDWMEPLPRGGGTGGGDDDREGRAGGRRRRGHRVRVLNGSSSVSEATRRRVLERDRAAGLRAQRRRARALHRTHVARSASSRPSSPSRRWSSACTASRASSPPPATSMVLFDVERPAPLGELTAGGRLDGLLCVSLCPSRRRARALRRRGRAGGARGLRASARCPACRSTTWRAGGWRPSTCWGSAIAGSPSSATTSDSPFGFTSRRRRRVGAAAALEEAGVELIVRRGPHGREHARTLAAELLAGDDPPTAIFAGSDSRPSACSRPPRRRGWTVPGRAVGRSASTTSRSPATWG